jgi:hypothetical protein
MDETLLTLPLGDMDELNDLEISNAPAAPPNKPKKTLDTAYKRPREMPADKWASIVEHPDNSRELSKEAPRARSFAFIFKHFGFVLSNQILEFVTTNKTIYRLLDNFCTARLA